MKTQLIHSFSTSSLTALSNSPSSRSKISSSPNTPRKFIPRRKKINSDTSSLDSVFFDDNDPENTINSRIGNTRWRIGSSDSDNNSNNQVSQEKEGCCSESISILFRKKTLRKRLPVLDWLPKYTLAWLVSDIIAGLTVGLTVLPQGLAYATVGELPQTYGLYSCFVGPFVYILFGSTKEINLGPSAIMAIITLSYTKDLPPEFAVLLSFLNGIVTLLLGVLQLGFIINFISVPVFSSFTSAAALTICSTQIKSILGLNYTSKSLLQVVINTIDNVDETNTSDLILAVVCMIVLIILQFLPNFTKKYTKHSIVADKIIWLICVARSALVIICATLYLGYTKNAIDVKIVGDLIPGLPAFKPPPFNFKDSEGVEYSIMDILKNESSALIVLPFLSLMEHITIAKYLAGLQVSTRTYKIDASQEMVSIGLSNLIGSFFSSMPITGSFCTTTVNHSSGVKTPLAGLFTGTLILLALQFLTPYFHYIPKAGLGAVIIVAVLVKVNFAILIPMWRSKKIDLIPWTLTFIVSLTLGLEFGILTGILVSLIFLMFYSARPKVRVKRGELQSGVDFILVDLDRSLVFPSVEFTINAIMKAANSFAKGHTPIVIDCHHIQFADFTFSKGLCDLFVLFNKRNQPLILWKLKDSILEIVIPVMSGVPFRHCRNDRELEQLLEELEEISREEKRKSGEIYIVVSPEEEEKAFNIQIIENGDKNNLDIPQKQQQQTDNLSIISSTNKEPNKNSSNDLEVGPPPNYDVFMTCNTEPAWLSEARNQNALVKR